MNHVTQKIPKHIDSKIGKKRKSNTGSEGEIRSERQQERERDGNNFDHYIWILFLYLHNLCFVT